MHTVSWQRFRKSDLPVVATPFTEAGIARPTLDEKEKPREVAADCIGRS